jgi:hypothetical protein
MLSLCSALKVIEAFVHQARDLEPKHLEMKNGSASLKNDNYVLENKTHRIPNKHQVEMLAVFDIRTTSFD